MSRVGKKIITIPDQVSVVVTGRVLSVKGPLGTVTRELNDEVTVTIAEKEITLAPAHNSIFARALWGTFGAHISNMIEGVTKGFEKKLLVEGIGYKIAVAGGRVVMELGFSHPVELSIPEGLKVTSEKGLVTIAGYDKEIVGQFAATIRAYKKTEPYKGKGIRYENEVVRRKQGKKNIA